MAPSILSGKGVIWTKVIQYLLMRASPSQKWLALGGLGMGIFMATLDSSIVNISLPTLVKAFNTNLATVQWVVLSYTLILTAFMLGVARLGDMRDKKKLYLIGLVLFTLGSFLCGLAPGVYWLIGFRGLQGLGATVMQALGMAMVTEIFPASERGKALGITGSIVSIGIAVGPALGGLIIASAGWPFIFWVNLPVGLLAFAVISRFVPASPPRKTDQRFDVAGAVLMFVLLGLYALGMTLGETDGFGSARTLALLAAAGGGLLIFVLVESRVQQPMVDLSLFRNPLFSINLLMGLLVFMTLAGNFIIPFYLELVQNYPTGMTGLLMITFPAAMGIIAPLAGVLSDRFGSRGISLAGLVVVVIGCLTASTLRQGLSPLEIVLRILPMGIGFGLFQSPNNSAIMGTASRERTGTVSGLLALSRTLGTTSGLPLMASLFSANVLAAGGLPRGANITAAPPAALVGGMSGTYLTAAWIIAASTFLAGVALVLDARRKKAARQSAQDVNPAD